MDLIQKIQNAIPDMSKGQKRIAEYILNNSEQAAYLSSTELGVEANVSESTVSRFAVELGFKGYLDFQKALQESNRNRLTAFQRMAATEQMIGNGNVLSKVMSSDSERIRKTLNDMDGTLFQEACDALLKADNVYVVGARSAAFLAGFIDYNLKMIFKNVHLVQTLAGSEIFEQMMNIGKNDVLFAISFPRYSKRVVRAVQYAHDRGAHVVTLTDSQASPIAALSDECLIAKSDMASFADNLVAPLSVVNALLVQLTRMNKDEVYNRLNNLEKLWEVYDVYAGKSEN